MRTDRSNPRLGAPQNSQRCLFLPFPLSWRHKGLESMPFIPPIFEAQFALFSSVSSPLMTRNRCLPFAHDAVKVHTYWDTNVRFWANIFRVKRGNREIASTFVEIICKCRLPSRVPDERTHVLHPIKMLTCWIRGKIIIIVCLVALKISWRFHHLIINPIIEIDDIATFLFYTIAVLTNSQSSDKARSNGSPQFSRT